MARRRAPGPRCGAGARCSARRRRGRRRSWRAPRADARSNASRRPRRSRGDPHALAAAAGAGLEQDRVADPVGPAEGGLGVARRRRRSRAGSARPPPAASALGGDLVAHRADRVRRRADERDARVGDRLGEVRVLGEEAEARDGSPSAPVGLARRDDLPRRPGRRRPACRRAARPPRRPRARRGRSRVRGVEDGDARRCPSARSVRMIRTAISPRLATRTFSGRLTSSGLREQRRDPTRPATRSASSSSIAAVALALRVVAQRRRAAACRRARLDDEVDRVQAGQLPALDRAPRAGSGRRTSATRSAVTCSRITSQRTPGGGRSAPMLAWLPLSPLRA